MILSVCLNCSLDTRYTVPGFEIGSIQSVQPPDITAGGKALNLARVAALLQEDVTAIGLVGERDMDFFSESMAAIGVQSRFTPVPTPTRRCLNIIDPKSHSTTEILEKGYPVDAMYFEEVLNLVRELAPDARAICASGSVPPGLGEDVYSRLGNLARELKLPFILDARGEHFRQGIKAQPFAVKPNRDELTQWLGAELTSKEGIIAALTQLNQKGVGLAIASLAGDGAIATCNGLAWHVQPPKVKAVNPVGSGDAFTAGLAVSLLRNLAIEESLCFAAACGTANALHLGTGNLDPDEVQRVLAQTVIQNLRGVSP